MSTVMSGVEQAVGRNADRDEVVTLTVTVEVVQISVLPWNMA